MRLEQPLSSFLDDLRSPEGHGPRRALALVGASAAALVESAAPEVSSEASTIRTKLEDLARRDPPQPEEWLPVAQEASAIFDLASRLKPSPPLAVAVALARAAAVGTVQLVTMSLDGIQDDMTRTAVKTKAQGLEQRARQAEADFLRSLLAS